MSRRFFNILHSSFRFLFPRKRIPSFPTQLF
nr:MAG TPA: hypothetical protein [Caudoviricetes sp.]